MPEDLRELLYQMREEAAEAWRVADPRKCVAAQVRRNQDLFARVEQMIGPTAWAELPPRTHIAWGDQAICHWTLHPPARWPSTQTSVKIADLVARLPCEDETYIEFVARPTGDWNGVTCDACRIRLPTLLRELGSALDDVHEGILEGFRAHPETLRAQELYARDVEPKLTAEQRQRFADQARQHAERYARRAARRSLRGAP